MQKPELAADEPRSDGETVRTAVARHSSRSALASTGCGRHELGLGRFCQTLGTTLILGLGWASPALAGKLSDLREETGSSRAPSSSGSSSSDGDDDDVILYLFGDDDCHRPPHGAPTGGDPQALAVTLAQPWFFPLYPYRGTVSGNLTRRHFTLRSPAPTNCSRFDSGCQAAQQVVACVDDTCYSDTRIPDKPSESVSTSIPQVQSVRGQFQLDAGTTHDGLWRGTIGGSVDSHRGVGLDTKLTYWVEPQPTQPSDGTLLGDVGLRFALFTSPGFNLRVGAGPRFQVDEVSKSAGFNGSLGAELYPFEPLVVRLEGDVGNLGQALVYEGQASVGVLLMRTEILAGVSSLHVGDVVLDAAFAGIRFHL